MNEETAPHTLDDLATIHSGQTPETRRSDGDGDIPWVRQSDVTRACPSPRLDSDDIARQTPASAWTHTDDLPLDPPFVLVATQGSVGDCVVVTEPVAFNQACHALVPEPGMDVDYLLYVLRHHRDTLEAMAEARSSDGIHQGMLRQLRCPCPSPITQRRVARVCRLLDGLRHRWRQKARTYQTIHRMWRTNRVQQALDSSRRLGDVVETIEREPSFYSPTYVESSRGVPEIRGDHLTARGIIEAPKCSVRHVRPFTARRLAHIAVAPGDMVITGRGDRIGRLGYVTETWSGAVITCNCFRIVWNEQVVDPRFARMVMASPLIRRHLRARMQDGAVPSIPEDALHALPWPECDPPVQTRWAQTDQRFLELRSRTQPYRQTLSNLQRAWFLHAVSS